MADPEHPFCTCLCYAANALARTITRENYFKVREKKAAVLSCGRNSGCWKTDGTHLPWELPDAPLPTRRKLGPAALLRSRDIRSNNLAAPL